jgi:hypothetical protein
MWEGKTMTGFFDSLTEEQKRKALNYRGEENHGDSAFRQSGGSVKFRPVDAAAYLGVAVSTLACWRSSGKGPAYLKVGSKIFYLRTQLDTFIESSVCNPGDTR